MYLKTIILLVLLPNAEWGTDRGAWIHQSTKLKLDFIRLQLSYLEAADIDVRSIGLACLSYLTQGAQAPPLLRLRSDGEGVFGEVVNAEHQMHWIVENVKLLRTSMAVEPVYTLLRAACKWMEDDDVYCHKLVMSCG